MKVEDKIFLLQAFHAFNGIPEIRNKFRRDASNISRLVAIVDSYGVDKYWEEMAEIRRMANEG